MTEYIYKDGRDGLELLPNEAWDESGPDDKMALTVIMDTLCALEVPTQGTEGSSGMLW
jgi:hypothetical protein